MRRLIRHRAFSVPVTVTLALGIGAMIAAFTVLESVVLSPLPYDDAERMVRIQTQVPKIDPETRWGLAKAEFLYFQREAESLASMGLYQLSRVTLEPEGDGVAQSMEAALVSSGVFPTLGVRPILGRMPEEIDHLAPEPRVAWLSHGLWLAHFGGDREIVGKMIPVDGRSIEVVGVLEPGARLPEEWVVPDIEIGMWMPLWLDPAQPPASSHVFRGLGRLDSGSSVEAAAAELDRLTSNLPTVLPEAYTVGYMEKMGMATELVPLHEDVVGEAISRSLWILFASVLVLLIIAAANATNLFLARAEVRRQEMAMRATLGAGNRSLLIAFLAESFIVAVIAGGLGLLLAQLALRVLRAEAPPGLPRLEAIGLGIPAVALTILLTLLAGVFFGVFPALRRYGARDVRASDTRHGVSIRGRLVRRALVVAQIALSLLLLVGGVLLYRSFLTLTRVDPGFEPRGVLTFSVILPSGRYDSYELVGTAYRTLATSIEEATGVSHAAVAMTLPLSGFDGCSTLFVPGQVLPEGEHRPCAPIYLVSPGYFDAMGIKVRGRAPDWADAERRSPFAVVSRSLADQLWSGEEPIGRGVALSRELDPFQVVGVAEDVRADGLDKPATAALYLPMTPPPGPELWPPLQSVKVIARTDTDRPTELVATVRRVVAEVDPQLPLTEIRPLSEVVARSMSRLSFFTLLLAAASGIGFVLSAVGIYGVVSYLVERRRTELGVRMALGARRSEVRRMVVTESVWLATAGVGVGIGAALMATNALQSLLYGVSARDPWTMVLVGVFLVVVAAVASWVPALRASKVPPAEVLRQE